MVRMKGRKAVRGLIVMTGDRDYETFKFYYIKQNKRQQQFKRKLYQSLNANTAMAYREKYNEGTSSTLQQYLQQFRNGGANNLKTETKDALSQFKSKMPNDYRKGALSPAPLSDYRSELTNHRDTYGARSYKLSETPSIKHSDHELSNYLNWVPPTKEKLAMQALQSNKYKSNRLSPLRAGPLSQLNEEDRRSQMSRTVLQIRDKGNKSQFGDREISIDGVSISASKPKHQRALSNVRTINNGYGGSGQIIDSSSLYLKKNGGLMSPAPKRNVLDELNWEDRQKVLGLSMAKLNTLRKDDILRAITLPDPSPHAAPLKRFSSIEEPSVDEALKKLARGGDDYQNLREYARALIKRWDTNYDGAISFQELCDGMKALDIHLALKDRVALMKKLDLNRDGELSDIELYKAIQSVESQVTREAVQNALRKIVGGAQDFTNMHEYAKSLIKKFDLNGDGLISFRELCDGLKKMGIVLSLRETQAFMDKLDFNKDGEITLEELSRVLQSSEAGSLSKYVSSLTADQVLSKLKTNGQNFNSMREYAKFLIRKFDDNNDGIISFRELSEGLKSLGMSLSIPEMKSLMKRLDFNKDGNITEEELVKVFSGQVADNQIPAGQFMQVINSALTKIASNADDLSNMKEYARYIVTRFDKDGDGLISFKELTDGCKTMNIFLTPLEKEGLMRKLDVNQDGDIEEKELYRALSSVNIDSLKQQAKEAAEIALKKIAGGAETYSNMRDYVKQLIDNFDGNGDGYISFSELCGGLKRMNVHLTLREKQGIMKKLDINRDGEISGEELYGILSKVDTKLSRAQIEVSTEQTLRKIASGADDFGSLKEYIQVMIERMDKDKDGQISFDELCQSLATFSIFLTTQERQAVMKKLDFNRDGQISKDEIYHALQGFERNTAASRFNSSSRRSPNMSPDLKVSFKQKELERITVDEIIAKVKKGASKYQSYKHFVSAIMRRYDQDQDGYLNFRELSDGLNYDNIQLSHQEKIVLMKHLDTDCDGVISRDEIFHALLLDGRHRRNHHFVRVNVDHLLKRIKQGAERFKSLDDFVKFLFEKLDTDGSGSLSFNELSVGLTNMGIEISNKEKHALMKKLDDDADGEISYDEFHRGLSEAGKFKQPTHVNPSQNLNVDHALKKIAIGAEQYKCLEDYIITLFKKFDVNKDGALSFKELREGLNSLNVHLADNEIHALFHKVDADRDGEITLEELYNAVLSKEKYFKSPKIGQQKVNVDHVLNLIKKGVEKYSSLSEYVKALMERFDINGDGSISIEELGEGLKSINVKISEKEKLALMKELDLDRDGGISQQELYNALAKPQHHFVAEKPNHLSTSPQRQGIHGNAPGLAAGVPHGIKKILFQVRKAIEHYKSQQEQLIGLQRIFDLDKDGLISYLELVDGIKALGITAKKTDMIDMMNIIDTDKDGFLTNMELYKALDMSPQHEGYQGTQAYINDVLMKLRRGAEKYHNLVEYVNYLFEQFAKTNSSFMSFHELMNCLKTFSFNLTQPEKLSLMKHLDENGDNQISKEEFYNALTAVKGYNPVKTTVKAAPVDPDDARVDGALRKIKAGAAQFKNLAEFCAATMKKLDTNKDGFITYLELVEGVRELYGIKVFKGEQAAMMRRLDEDRDGVISYDELFKALSRV